MWNLIVNSKTLDLLLTLALRSWRVLFFLSTITKNGSFAIYDLLAWPGLRGKSSNLFHWYGVKTPPKYQSLTSYFRLHRRRKFCVASHANVTRVLYHHLWWSSDIFFWIFRLYHASVVYFCDSLDFKRYVSVEFYKERSSCNSVLMTLTFCKFDLANENRGRGGGGSSIFKGCGCSSVILKRTPKRYQDPVLCGLNFLTTQRYSSKITH